VQALWTLMLLGNDSPMLPDSMLLRVCICREPGTSQWQLADQATAAALAAEGGMAGRAHKKARNRRPKWNSKEGVRGLKTGEIGPWPGRSPLSLALTLR